MFFCEIWWCMDTEVKERKIPTSTSEWAWAGGVRVRKARLSQRVALVRADNDTWVPPTDVFLYLTFLFQQYIAQFSLFFVYLFTIALIIYYSVSLSCLHMPLNKLYTYTIDHILYFFLQFKCNDFRWIWYMNANLINMFLKFNY